MPWRKLWTTFYNNSGLVNVVEITEKLLSHMQSAASMLLKYSVVNQLRRPRGLKCQSTGRGCVSDNQSTVKPIIRSNSSYFSSFYNFNPIFHSIKTHSPRRNHCLGIFGGSLYVRIKLQISKTRKGGGEGVWKLLKKENLKHKNDWNLNFEENN